MDWSDLEITACLLAYLKMLAKEQNGEPYNKAEVNRRLRDDILSSRSKGSVERRMMNIKAFLEQKGLPTIKGYKPYANIGPTKTLRLAHLS